VQAAQRVALTLRLGRGRLLRVFLGQSSSLRALRRRLSAFVRALRRYYTTVRLPTNVHIGLVVHHLLQPARALPRAGRWWGLPDLARGVSMHAGVFDLAESSRCSQFRTCWCGLPPLGTASAL